MECHAKTSTKRNAMMVGEHAKCVKNRQHAMVPVAQPIQTNTGNAELEL